ncbi:Hypothetical protein FKW44_007664 [Caligus rogercresseyi]|uniref:Uncharacterized protein n=1 Tax=Caligus rogercresseyi TaxID=217165 RepID=A0A7T8QTQ6_CALRO|nr:Hypothetical protein FKW44_007664 [Caligus rogercresseyi]
MKRSVSTKRLTKGVAGKILRTRPLMIGILGVQRICEDHWEGGQADLGMKPSSIGRYIYQARPPGSEKLDQIWFSNGTQTTLVSL